MHVHIMDFCIIFFWIEMEFACMIAKDVTVMIKFVSILFCCDIYLVGYSIEKVNVLIFTSFRLYDLYKHYVYISA